MYEPLKLELAMWSQYKKFQPTPEPDGVHLPNITRSYLEYDGKTGEFVERVPVTGEVLDAGVIEVLRREEVQEAA